MTFEGEDEGDALSNGKSHMLAQTIGQREQKSSEQIVGEQIFGRRTSSGVARGGPGSSLPCFREIKKKRENEKRRGMSPSRARAS